MPSFPASVKSFTTKNAGDVIQNTHLNDLQDEVNAMEGGYLNGTARLNSSGSTLATLSVSGGSTFAVRPATPPPDAAKVFLQSTVTIGTSGASTFAWTAQAFLTNSSMHSTTTNNNRLIPQSTGLYQVVAQMGLSTNSTGFRTLTIVDSSGTNIARTDIAANSGDVYMSAMGFKYFDALGGYAAAVGDFTGQSTLSILSGVGATWFAMVKL